MTIDHMNKLEGVNGRTKKTSGKASKVAVHNVRLRTLRTMTKVRPRGPCNCPWIKNGRDVMAGLDDLLREYLPILIFFGVAAGVAVAAVSASFIIARQKPDPEKVSAYECGFEAFTDSRGKFDVRFYLVAILFIIFDLEVAFLFPWAVALGDIGAFGFWSMMAFLGILTVGFIYEWKKGALEWE